MSQIFSPKIITKTPSRNRFPLSYYSRVTTRMGDLVPVLCKKVIAGDRWKVSLSSITRLAPLANPVYDRVKITYDAFFVQNRIIDPDFKNFISPDPEGTSSDNPSRDITALYAFSTSDKARFRQLFGIGSLMDYLGFQFAAYDSDGTPEWGSATTATQIQVNACPILGYYKIWDNWYRNERFQSSVYKLAMRNYELSSTRAISGILDYPDLNEYGFLRVNYGKDLYTTALETPMVGGPVNIPAGSSQIPIELKDSQEDVYGLTADVTSSGVTLKSEDASTTTGASLIADMKNAVLGTIQELKFAYSLFSFYMKDTYNGNRYVEFMKAHFGVDVPDSTLERSLFLGRITQWINFSEIFQTSGSTSEDNTLGDYAGIGVSNGSGFLFDSTFLEHGYLYILMSIRPNATYFQGIDRKFFFGDRFDSFYFPEFQNIGDKPIYTCELYNRYGSGFEDSTLFSGVLSWVNINNSDIFGYNRANSEYIWFHDEMHGNFLKENSERNWTFARSFATAPKLGSEFSEVTPINNPFTFTDEESLNFYTDILFDIKALRPIVRYEHY